MNFLDRDQLSLEIALHFIPATEAGYLVPPPARHCAVNDFYQISLPRSLWRLDLKSGPISPWFLSPVLRLGRAKSSN
jgi:hypothetical protein